MEFLQSVFLGAVQGITEFIPVSSSGHLALAKMMFENADTNLMSTPLVMEIILHLATLLAISAIYRKSIADIITGFFGGLKDLFKKREIKHSDDFLMAVAIITGTIPTGILGLLLRDTSASVSYSPVYLASSFFACAAILFSTKFMKKGENKINMKKALIIGIVQGLAVIPGISRSGATIAAGLMLGVKREECAKFSFLLSIPAILGAAFLELDLDKLDNENITNYLAGGFVAFIVGLFALLLLLKFVKKGRLWIFSIWVAVSGVVSLLI